jgi:oxygen-dependent protoporphyrinogen oxidase
MPKIVVIGGGVTGLAAAHRLVELSQERNTPVEVQVMESSSRLGGITATRQAESYLMEEGPDSFITDKPWALDLCRRLGLERDLVPTNPARQSHVLWDGKLHPIPEGFHIMAPGKLRAVLKSSLFSMEGKTRIAMERLVRPRQDKEDESVASFVQRRLGPEALERIVQPLVSGIYGGGVDEMSMLASFSKFVEMEKEYGSLTAAMKAGEKNAPPDGTSGARYSLFMTLWRGMGSLVNALYESLPQGAAVVTAAVQSIVRVSGRWDITLDTGYKTSADGVIIALPAPKAAKLLRALDSGVADTLAGVKYAASANVHFAFPWTSITKSPEGFGFVVPAVLKLPILGCTFSSAKFPGRAPKDVALLRAFIAPTHLDLDDEEILEKAKGTLKQVLGIQGEPMFGVFKRHAQVLPQYTVGHPARMAGLDWRVKIIPRLTVAGNAYRGVGLPDCIKSAEDAAELLLAKMAQPSHE